MQQIALPIVFILAFLSCSPVHRGVRQEIDVRKLTGIGFRFGSLRNGVCLDVLRNDCRLSLRQDGSIPREAGEALEIRNQVGAMRVVSDPADLIGCVRISSREEALTYVRFFSSFWTIHWFSEKKMEVFKNSSPDCPGICLPKDVWEKHKLADPLVAEVPEGFEITRYVMKPEHEFEATLFQVVERIDHDGRVEELSSRPIDLPENARMLLGFPHIY